jgi:hypothetical protein
MKKCASFFLLLLLGTAVESAPFQNLGFDSYDTNSSLLPGWHINNPIFNVPPNTSQGTFIGVNQVTLGLNYHTLYDGNILPGVGYAFPAFGKYSLGFWPGIDGSGVYTPYSLSQTGDVPPDAMSIHFIDFGGPFELRINGSVVPLIYNYPPSLIKGDYSTPVNVYGDVSMFAGQSVELNFTTVQDLPYQLNGIDDISFSSQIAPEPTTWLLFGLGGLGLLARRKIFR